MRLLLLNILLILFSFNSADDAGEIAIINLIQLNFSDFSM